LLFGEIGAVKPDMKKKKKKPGGAPKTLPGILKSFVTEPSYISISSLYASIRPTLEWFATPGHPIARRTWHMMVWMYVSENFRAMICANTEKRVADVYFNGVVSNHIIQSFEERYVRDRQDIKRITHSLHDIHRFICYTCGKYAEDGETVEQQIKPPPECVMLEWIVYDSVATSYASV
jgi:hypothetical protein